MAKGVKFGEGSARRIIAATRAYERGNRDQSPVKFRTVSDDGENGLLGKTDGDWDKNTLAAITIYDSGTAGDEQPSDPPRVISDCVNKFADIDADSWVWLALNPNGFWYVTAAECTAPGSS
jgi:hypothetical protein